MKTEQSRGQSVIAVEFTKLTPRPPLLKDGCTQTQVFNLPTVHVRPRDLQPDESERPRAIRLTPTAESSSRVKGQAVDPKLHSTGKKKRRHARKGLVPRAALPSFISHPLIV